MERKELEKLTRERLNSLAIEHGVADPDRHDTKGEVIDALLRSVAGGFPPTEEPEERGHADPGDTNSSGFGSETSGQLLVVEGAQPGRCCLFEQHPDHPGGEVFIVGGQRARVAPTSAVSLAIGQGRLRLV